MPSKFDEHDRAAQRAIEAQFAQRVRVEPKIESQYRGPVADPMREAAIVMAIYSEAQASQQVKGSARGAETVGVTRVASGMKELWISRDAYEGLGYAVYSGDEFVLIDAPDMPRYVASRVFHGSPGSGVTIHLTSKAP